jgi:hypothetical protein
MDMAKVILTKHARERMSLRRIDESVVKTAIEKYNKKEPEDDGDTQFIRDIKRSGQTRQLHVIAKPLPEEGKDAWLVKTVWIRGEDDPNFLVRIFHAIFGRFFGGKK